MGRQLSWLPLFDRLQHIQNRVIDRSDTVVFIKKAPAHDAGSINNEDRRLGNLPIRVVETVSIDNAVTCVGEDWEGEFEVVYKLAALILIVNADGYDLGAGSSELVIVGGQTGQLLSAVWSPVAAIEHEH